MRLMRPTLFVLTLFSVMFCRQTSYAQTITEQQETFSFDILLGCGFSGETSYDITHMKTLILQKNYVEIAKSLDSPAPLRRLAAVIALEELSKRGLFKLSATQNAGISRVKRSSQPYSLCSGCTWHSKGIISDIFTRNPNEKNFLNPEYHIKYMIGLGD
jgi:hypothetical protein